MRDKLRARGRQGSPCFDPNEVSPLTAFPDRLAVHAHVDSRKACGVEIRTNYTCVVSPLAIDAGSCTNCSLGSDEDQL